MENYPWWVGGWLGVWVGVWVGGGVGGWVGVWVFLLIYTICISILCVLQEGLSLVESNQQVSSFASD